MPKYVIEREIPGAGNMSQRELQSVSQKSCGVLQNLGPQIQWLQSYVTGDKIYCIYIAPNEEMVRELEPGMEFLPAQHGTRSVAEMRERNSLTMWPQASQLPSPALLLPLVPLPV